MKGISLSLNKYVFVLTLLFTGLILTNTVHAEELLFSDDFARSDSGSLGSPNIGGTWTEANESLVTDTSTNFIRKTYIQLSDGKFDVVYDIGLAYVNTRHAYAYARLTKTASLSVTASFSFTPHETARMHHEVALMDYSKGFYETLDGAGQPLYFPIDGVGVFIARSNIDYNNSQIYFATYNSGNRVVHLPANRLLPFQLMPGVPYNVDFAIDPSGLLTAKITSGTQSATVTDQIPLSELTNLNLNQISVTDAQGAAFTTNVNHTYFDNFNVVSKTNNQFPLYTQTISAYPSVAETTSWANQSLAGGTAGTHCPTIATCGCAITSTVMLARSYGITKGIDGSDVNPGNFNQWLTAHSGYRPGGNLDFAQAVKYFGTEENGVQKSYFKFKDAPLSDAGVKQRVTSGVPVVSQMNAKFRRNSEERGTHFVLVTESLGVGQYGVNDPVWFNTKNLDDDASRTTMVQDYNDRIINGRDLTFTSTPVMVASAFSASLVGQTSVLSAVSFVRTTMILTSGTQAENGTAPAEMFMVTPIGGRLGLDPRTGQNSALANGYYGSEAFLSNLLDENTSPSTDVLKSLSASELASGEYKVHVVGTGNGTYKYSGLVHDTTGHEHTFSFTGETARGMVDVYAFNVVTGELALLPIDKDALTQIIDAEISDVTINKFFKMWSEKIMGEIAEGKLAQAKQHIETFRTLMKAKKVDSPALNLLLKKLEAQIG